MSVRTLVFLLLVVFAIGAQVDRLRFGIDGDGISDVGTAAGPPPEKFPGKAVPVSVPREPMSVGPFLAPHSIEIELASSTLATGASLRLHDVASKEEIDLPIQQVASQLHGYIFRLPTEWRGRPVVLTLRRTTDSGWLLYGGIRRVPGWLPDSARSLARLSAFLLVGTMALVTATAASRFIRRFSGARSHLAVLLAIAALALASHVVFWLFVVNPLIGRIACWAILIVALLSVSPAKLTMAASSRRHLDWLVPAGLMIAAGLFYFGALHLFAVDQPLSFLAQWRFTAGLPNDNELPQLLASRVYTGSPWEPFRGDWLAVDRPPLQSGWILLFAELALRLGIDFDTAAQSASIWLQLAWLPAAWAVLRELKTEPRTAAVISALLIPTGFLFLNSVFVWPKLAAGAFALGSYLLVFPASPSQPTRTGDVGGGLLAALSWITHSGVAFSFIALIPLLAWKRVSGRRLHWIAAAIAFAAVALPWEVCKRNFDPPGNRLVKWHIGGAIAPDGRGVVETIVDSYRKTTAGEALEARWSNVRVLAAGDWRRLLHFDVSDPQRHRDDNSFLLHALGYWNVGFAALTALCCIPALRHRLGPERWKNLRRIFVWCLLTITVWVALMFFPIATFVHQGSYTVLIALPLVLALALHAVHPLALWSVGAVQVVYFAAVWLPRPGHWSGPPVDPVASMSLLVGVVALVLMCVKAGTSTTASEQSYV